MLDFSVFSDFTEAEREQIRSASSLRTFPAKARIFQEGEPGDGLYFVLDGHVTLFRRLPGAPEQILATFRSGSYFGEMAILEERSRLASARAESHTETLFVPSRMFDGTLAEPEIRQKLIRAFLGEAFRRLRETNRIAAEILSRSSQAKEELRTLRQGMRELSGSGRPASSGEAGAGIGALLERTAQRIEEMVDEISHLTHVNGLALNLGRTKVCLEELLEKVLKRSASRLASKALDLKVTKSGAPLWVSGDQYLLERAMTDLVDEAIGSAKPGGKVLVESMAPDHNGNRLVEVRLFSEGDAPADPRDHDSTPAASRLSSVRKTAWTHGGSFTTRRVLEPFSANLYSFGLPPDMEGRAGF